MRSLEVGVYGAYCNVLTNLENLSHHSHAEEVSAEECINTYTFMFAS